VSSGGQSAYIRDGKSYGVTRGLFNHRWWNYFERGVSFSDGKFWPEATNDLKEAIRQRDKDQRRTRTYGMHFMDYFPHRELGIVYYNTAQYDQAIQELEQSLWHEESAKAKFYLNKAREQKISRLNLDKEPPKLELTSLPDDMAVNNSLLSIKGVATDDTYVSTILLNGKPLFLELAQQTLPFEHTITLAPGKNNLTVKAVDMGGKEVTVERNIVLDMNGPVFTIADILKRPNDTYFISGYVDDSNGISRFSLNGSDRLIKMGTREIAFEEAVSSPIIEFIAVDSAGNKSSETIDLLEENSLSLAGWPREMIMTASTDQSAPYIQKKSSASLQKPLIEPKGLTEDQDTFLDKIFLEGRAIATKKINSVTINESPLQFRPGKQVYFNHLAELKEGENTFTIIVEDSVGTFNEKTITINRKITKARDIGSRLVLGVMPFILTSNTGELSEPAFDFFQTKLVEKNRFHLVTRQDLDKVLQELKLSQTELVNPQSAAKIGKLVVADNIISGKVFEKGKSIEVTVNDINTETSTIMASFDVYSESTDLRNLQHLMEGLSLKLEKQFPLLEGLIIKIKEEKYFLDLGNTSGLKSEMQIIAFREGEAIYHPITNKLLGADTEELGVLTVTSAQKDFSVAELRSQGKKEIQEMDKFITR
jgi:hypothetical protein